MTRSGKNVHESLKSRKTELNTVELQHFQEERQQTLADVLKSDEDEVWESVPSSSTKEMCEMGRSAVICENYHPDTMLSNRAVHILNDNSMTHFRKMRLVIMHYYYGLLFCICIVYSVL